LQCFVSIFEKWYRKCRQFVVTLACEQLYMVEMVIRTDNISNEGARWTSRGDVTTRVQEETSTI
jgi:hypothetical protein